MRAKTDFRAINRYIAKSPEIRRACLRLLEKNVEEAKNQLIEEFVSHPVSAEISAGSNASNSSGTLNGYGNLFTFIGFSSGDNPVDRWANFIRKHVVLRGGQKISFQENSFNITFEIPSISDQELLQNSSMPWEPGRSWIRGIERGISGFSNYISKRAKGRSGGGIQSKYPARSGQFSRSSYWSKMWSSFIKNISK